MNIGGENNPVYSRCIWVKIFCFLCDFGSVVSYKLPVLGTFMVVLGSYVNVPVLSQKETLFQEEQCTSCLGFSHIEIYGSYGCIFMKMIQSCEHYNYYLVTWSGIFYSSVIINSRFMSNGGFIEFLIFNCILFWKQYHIYDTYK